MLLRANPYQIFKLSKTPAGLYARQKWLGEQRNKSWKMDFKNTVKKLQAGQLPDGSWGQSVVMTIQRLFGLHLTIRESNTPINRGLEWLIDRCMENFPRKRVSPKWGIRGNPLKGLPFSWDQLGPGPPPNPLLYFVSPGMAPSSRAFRKRLRINHPFEPLPL